MNKWIVIVVALIVIVGGWMLLSGEDDAQVDGGDDLGSDLDSLSNEELVEGLVVDENDDVFVEDLLV